MESLFALAFLAMVVFSFCVSVTVVIDRKRNR